MLHLIGKLENLKINLEKVEENQINIFGHIYDKPLDRKFDKKIIYVFLMM